MTRNLVAMTVLAAGAMFGQYRDEYGRPGANDPGYGYSDVDDRYANDGYAAPAPPPPMPYAYGGGYRRPPMPGPGFVWVDGYWSFLRGRYVWVSGYWTRPPFAGGLWMAPRWNGGRFFAGFWSRPGYGGGGGFSGGYGYRGGGTGHGHDRRGRGGRR